MWWYRARGSPRGDRKRRGELFIISLQIGLKCRVGIADIRLVSRFLLGGDMRGRTWTIAAVVMAVGAVPATAEQAGKALRRAPVAPAPVAAPAPATAPTSSPAPSRPAVWIPAPTSGIKWTVRVRVR